MRCAHCEHTLTLSMLLESHLDDHLSRVAKILHNHSYLATGEHPLIALVIHIPQSTAEPRCLLQLFAKAAYSGEVLPIRVVKLSKLAEIVIFDLKSFHVFDL